MRQAAWLNTAPKDPAHDKPHSLKTKRPPPMTRLRKLKEDGVEPAFPLVGAGAHLLEYFFDVGPVMVGAMGPVPLSHTELAAWQANTGLELSGWEAATLRRMSTEYVCAARDAEDPACPAPFQGEAPEQRRDRVADAVSRIFGARARKTH